MNDERLYKVLLAPHTTEKTSRIADLKQRQIAFKVLRDATKQDIKKAVEKFFKVTVETVRTLNVKGKTCRFGGRQGKHQDWKKAYVILKEGDDINFGGVE